MLPVVATPLPTPKASDGPNGGPGMRNGRGEVDALPGVVPAHAAGQWGDYAPAIAQWATIIGRPAPNPTEPGRDGKPRLAPTFVEWMMGLPAGWVTNPAIGLSRAQQLKALGNGVVPQQAALALRLLLAQP
jgi:DNA (cytosine-5)-methyltransferase 1